MDQSEALETVLRAFTRYYNINRDNPTPPFVAEAEFIARDERYFLVKSARIGAADTQEKVYFAVMDVLDEETLSKLDALAWERGLAGVEPDSHHKSSDVILIILADRLEAGAIGLTSALKHHKSYRHGLWGWSHYRLAVAELSTQKTFGNREGRDMRVLLQKQLFRGRKK